jgi:hypothetical protein
LIDHILKLALVLVLSKDSHRFSYNIPKIPQYNQAAALHSARVIVHMKAINLLFSTASLTLLITLSISSFHNLLYLKQNKKARDIRIFLRHLLLS